MGNYDKVVVVEASTLCNLSCPFCAYDSRLKIKRLFFDSDLLRNLVNQMGLWSMASNKTVLVSWLGGEPLLHQDLFSITSAAKKQFPLHFSATTNGTPLVKKEVIHHIVENYSELTISLDGFSEFHDTMRGYSGLYELIKKSVREIIGLRNTIKLRVNVVLMKDNIDGFESLCYELSRWGVHEITFNQLGGRDRPEFYPEHRLRPPQVEALFSSIERIQQTLSGTNTKLVYNEAYYNRIWATTHEVKLPIEDCKPGQYYMFINASGVAAPCPYTPEEYGVSVSEIQSAVDFDDLPTIFSQKRKIKKSSYCHDCPCTNVHGKF